jgi:hypothetical protein
VDRWTIGLDSWIIQDGNYPDFEVGGQDVFGVEAFPDELRRVDVQSPSAIVMEGSRYALSGRVSYVHGEAWVIDVGISCYGNRKLPAGAAAGDGVTGEAYLGIEGPGVFDEAFFRSAPPFRYSWRIDRIQLETTPWVEVGPRSLARDESRVGYRDVARTNAWEDDDGRAHYLLECAVVGGQTR